MSTASSLTPAGTGYVDVSANGTRTYSACVPSIRWPEDPSATAETLAVAALAAEPARAARGDARHEHPVAGLTFLTPAPTDSTVPTASWPRMRPSVTSGTSPFRMCRSVPQIVTASTRTIASVSATIVGLATSSHALLSGP